MIDNRQPSLLLTPCARLIYQSHSSGLPLFPRAFVRDDKNIQEQNLYRVLRTSNRFVQFNGKLSTLNARKRERQPQLVQFSLCSRVLVCDDEKLCRPFVYAELGKHAQHGSAATLARQGTPRSSNSQSSTTWTTHLLKQNKPRREPI